MIISDRHPFVVEEFQDPVLYIDHTASAEEMFRQIDEHVKWIRTHPKESREFAKKAHAVFTGKFFMETILDDLKIFHEKVVDHK